MDVCCLRAEARVRDDEGWKWVRWKYGKDHQISEMVDIILVCISHTFYYPKAVHLPIFTEPLLPQLHPTSVELESLRC